MTTTTLITTLLNAETAKMGGMDESEFKRLKKAAEKFNEKLMAAERIQEENKRMQARAAIEKIAKEHGFSLEELITTEKSKKKQKLKKYQSPDDPKQTWGGRGPQPQWFKDALAAGKKKEDMEIKK